VPDAEVLIVGDNREGYGFPAPAGSTWKAEMLREVGDRLDMERVHFLGRISRAHLLAAFSISRARVYYTYPFVLSWSLLEAMACERTIIASDTAPVREVMTDGKDGLLLDFFDVEALSTTLIDCCRHPKKHAALRKAARRTVVEHYDRKRHCIPAWLDLIDSVRRA
jgi:glycosyltransferase involved in cell wall biosynthesis